MGSTSVRLAAVLLATFFPAELVLRESCAAPGRAAKSMVRVARS